MSRRPAPNEPRITRLRGGFAVSYFEDGKRRRFSLGTNDPEEAKRRFAVWEGPSPPTAFNRVPSVYFIQCENRDGFIKIGLASHIANRLSLLQISSPYPLKLLAIMPGGRTEEATLHRRFAWAHVRGEWFRPVQDLLAVIEPWANRADEIEAPAADPVAQMREAWADFPHPVT